MPTSFIYYGGKTISDSGILKEIAKIESNIDNGQKENLKISGEIECRFVDKTVNIILREEIGDGGEGCIYETNIDGLVAKIYFSRMRTISRKEKIELMVKNQIYDESICWPTGILFHKGSFVGFVMPLINRKVYVDFDPIGDCGETEEFLKKDKRNALKLLINVMDIFEKLRAYNVVMGDINHRNFLINKNNFKVILIDLDGAQIDKYPCVTCDDNFNAPELFKHANIDDIDTFEETNYAIEYYHKVYSNFLRDYFSLAVYSFNYLMCINPYCNVKDLSKCFFKYDLTDEQVTLNNRTSEAFSKRWAHLPFFIRESFHKCFTTDDPNERLTPKQWKKVFTYYLNLLNYDKLVELDNECLTLYHFNEKPFGYDILKDVKMLLKTSIISSAFTMKDAVKRLSSDLKKNGVKYDIDVPMVSEYLKHNRVLKIDNYTFKLLFNIGVLKKVAIEYKSS